MDTKKALRNLLLIPLILLFAFQCKNDRKLLENIPESDFIQNCPDVLYEYGDIITIGDPNDRFMIDIPYSWDIRESYSDSVYGIFASNFLSIPKSDEDKLAISVSGYTSEKSIGDYFNDEVLSLIKEDQISVLERGNVMLTGKYYPWVLFKMFDGSLNMVYYLKQENMNNYYLIQTASYDSVNYRNKLCYLKQLVNTFEIVRN